MNATDDSINIVLTQFRNKQWHTKQCS